MSETPNPPVSTPTPTPAPSPAPNESQIRQWNMWCHLSALAGFVVPFGNLLGPLLVWQIKKDEIPSVVAHGKAALNFQITVAIAVILCVVLAIILSFFCIGFLLFPVIGLIHLCGPIFGIIAGIKANEGKEYRYPWSLTLVR